MKTDSPGSESIDEYIAAADPAVRERLEAMRATIRSAAPEAIEAIKYRLPTFVLRQNLVHFGAFENHVGFYPTESGIAAFAQELANFKTSRGAVRFPHDRPLPLDLVRRIVEFRVEQVRTLSQSKSRRKS